MAERVQAMRVQAMAERVYSFMWQRVYEEVTSGTMFAHTASQIAQHIRSHYGVKHVNQHVLSKALYLLYTNNMCFFYIGSASDGEDNVMWSADVYDFFGWYSNHRMMFTPQWLL